MIKNAIVLMALTFLFCTCCSNFNLRPKTTTHEFKYFLVTESIVNVCNVKCTVNPIELTDSKLEKMKRVFKSYESVCNVKFTKVSTIEECDIIIGEHDFDNDIVGHATPGFLCVFPALKTHFIHLKSNLTFNFEHVFKHELGHVLGLNHNPNEKSVMYERSNWHDDLDSWDIFILVREFGPPLLK